MRRSDVVRRRSDREQRLEAQVKRLRTALKRDRFVALCAGSAGRGSVVYGLDASGKVWRFSYQTEVWIEVGMTRVRKGEPGYPAPVQAAPEAAQAAVAK